MTANKFYFGIARRLEKAAGCFPAQKNEQGIAYGVEGAVDYFHQGYSLLLFPEGKRNRVPGGLPAKPGIEKILAMIGPQKLVLCHISMRGRHMSIRYTARHSSEFNSAQEIIDACYQLPI